MSLYDVLKKHNSTSCILLYGNTTDVVISKDLCVRDFRLALHSILREVGYDNVVFYDYTNASGKFVYDDDSAVYTGISQRRSKTTENTDVKQQDNKRRTVQFGKPRKKVQPEESDRKTIKDDIVDDSQNPMKYQQRNMVEEVFYGELETYMKNNKYRSAVVLTDINNFLRNSSVKDKFSEDIRYNWNKDNLLIFIHPDLKSPCDREFYHLLREVSLLSEFYDKEKGEDNYSPKKNRVFKIGDFSHDEILYLLTRYKILNGLQIEGSIQSKVEMIDCVIKQNRDKQKMQLSLRDLDDRFQMQFCKNRKSLLDNEMIESVLQCNLKDIELDPWKTLQNRSGWEDVVERIKNIVRVAPIYQGGEERQNNSSFIVRRFGSDSTTKIYPDSSKLPHIMIEGAPGTGKTTAIQSITRIMYNAGVIAERKYKTVGVSTLVGEYVGSTSIKVREAIEEAEGGVLFIDEAHQLCDYSEDSNEGAFKLEAIQEIVRAMTDEATHVLFIVAGYRSTPGANDGVQGLFSKDPGLRRRFSDDHVISIPDYTPNVLEQIFYKVIKEQGYTLGDTLSVEDIHRFMENVYQKRNRREFGNGSYIHKELIQNVLIPNAKKRGDNETIQKIDFGEKQIEFEIVTMETIKKEFYDMPGLKEIGFEIVNRYVQRRQMDKADHINAEEQQNPPHLILVGRPGTGKTTMANMLCRALGAVKMMSGLDPVTITNASSILIHDLEKKIKEAVNKNTILFIDEAHNCRDEVIKALLNPMSENSKLTCLFAVYSDKYKEFIQKDKGLLGRCEVNILPDYTSSQLFDIFLYLADKQKCVCSEEVLHGLSVLFENWYVNREFDEDYSNARQVTKLFEKIKLNYFARVGNAVYSAEEKHQFEMKDIPEETRKLIESQDHANSIEDILQEINTYCGWNNLKQWLITMNESIEAKTRNPKLSIEREHLCFVGSPGTGKSTAAELVSEACFAMGLTSLRRFKKYKPEDLLEGYVEQSRQKCLNALEAGRGGVIFIDEAYGLAYNSSVQANSFNHEAVETLLAFAEEHRSDTLIILAGYKNDIKRLINSNEGLVSRFSKIIEFPNFNADECTSIMMSRLEKECEIDSECKTTVLPLFKEICQNTDFSNARDVRNICGRIKTQYIHRITADIDESIFITPDDIIKGFDDWKKDKDNMKSVM